MQLLDGDIIEAFATWVSECRRGNIAIVKSASTGSGVTTMIREVLHRSRCEAVYVTTATKRVRDFLSDSSMTTYTALERKKKVLIIDPIDAIFADPTAAADILDVLKIREMRSLPVVCTGFLQRSTLARVIDAVGKRHQDDLTIFDFPRITDAVAVTALRQIHTKYTEAEILQTWERSAADFRAASVALSMTGQANVKDDICDGLDALKRILFEPGVDVLDAIRLHGSDPTLLTMGAFENYHLANPDIATCSVIADAYAHADTIDERIFGRQEYELLEYHASLAAGYAVTLLPKNGGIAQIEKVGSVWSRNSNQRSKEKTVQLISRCLFEVGWSRLDVPDMAYLRGTILLLAKDQRFDELVGLVGSLDDSTVLNIMRLFKTAYTQVDHTRYKKRRLAQHDVGIK